MQWMFQCYLDQFLIVEYVVVIDVVLMVVEYGIYLNIRQKVWMFNWQWLRLSSHRFVILSAYCIATSQPEYQRLRVKPNWIVTFFFVSLSVFCEAKPKSPGSHGHRWRAASPTSRWFALAGPFQLQLAQIDRTQINWSKLRSKEALYKSIEANFIRFNITQINCETFGQSDLITYISSIHHYCL